MTKPVSSVTDGNKREWRFAHVLYLAAAAIILFVVVFWSALGLPPLGGTAVEWALGAIFAALANLSLGTLVSGAVIEFRHPEWSRLHLLEHIFMAIAILALVGADVGIGIWFFASTSGALSGWLVAVIMLAAFAMGHGSPGITRRSGCGPMPTAASRDSHSGPIMMPTHLKPSSGVHSPRCRC